MRIVDHRGDQNVGSAKTKLPVPAVGGEHFIGDDNERQMRELARDVRAVILPWGHQLAEEPPDELAGHNLRFFRGEL